MVTPSVNGLIVIDAVADAVFVLESVMVTDTDFVPFVLYVVVKLDPVPVAGLPPVAVQLNVYGDVPPVPAAVNVTAAPTVPVVGPPIVTASVSGLIMIVAEAVAVFAFPSVMITETVKVPLTL
jgi:hypothetical protein